MTKMTRFEKELSGELGEYWVKSTTEEIQDIERKYETGDLIINLDGTAQWKCGNYVPDHVLEIILHSKYANLIDVDNHKKALDFQTEQSIAEYKERMKSHVYTEEELWEIRAAFGTGTVITDVLTGRTIQL